MRAFPRMREPRVHIALIGALVLALLLTWPALGVAHAADPRLEKAQQQRQQVQSELDTLLQRLHALESELESAQAELSALQAAEQSQQAQAQAASGTLAQRVRESYIRGTGEPSLALLASGSIDEAREQARLLGVLAMRSRGEMEEATAARTRTLATAAEVEHAAEQLRGRRAEVDAVRAEVAQALQRAQAEEQRVRNVLAAEQAERERKAREAAEREAAARAQRQRASRTQAAQTRSQPAAVPRTATAAPAAAVSGNVACPVGQPRSYSDTWGAPRSGGRAHKGTDIMAPRGTPIYAYESGTVSRLWNSRLGGISLYLQGDSGTVYYYTHLQGYVSGLSGGQRVSVGQHVAFNGDTGNARGIPHLHFEVMPGGGGNVNPYPYVKRACG